MQTNKNLQNFKDTLIVGNIFLAPRYNDPHELTLICDDCINETDVNMESGVKRFNEGLVSFKINQKKIKQTW